VKKKQWRLLISEREITPFSAFFCLDNGLVQDQETSPSYRRVSGVQAGLNRPFSVNSKIGDSGKSTAN